MTKLEALQKSLAMWLWLAEDIERDKADYFREMHIGIYPRAFCYVCQYHMTSDGDCKGDCPINWGDNRPYACEDHPESPYAIWSEGHHEYHDHDREDAAWGIVRLHQEAIENETSKAT